jgi:superfamily II DNA or RNA helicase/phage anti-repressor protein
MAALIHGTKYEHYVKRFIANNYKSIWLWNEIPINILHELNIIPCTQTTCDDIGCDILALTNNNEYCFIQCKNYSTIGFDNTINICDLAGFYNFMAENKFSNGIVYYSGCLSSQVIKRTKSIKYINLPYNLCESIKLTPHSYQINAYNKLSVPGRNVLTMPCGTGKTYVSYLLSANYKNIILLSPLISTAEQLYQFYTNYYSNTDSCNITIFNCMRKNKQICLDKQNVIISTYDSVNLIYDEVSKLTHKIIIIDEYHNLSNSNLTNCNDSMYKLLLNLEDSTYLFMSATPHKQYSKYANIFGTNEYYLSWEDAIANKYICDYRFYYPNPDIVETKICELKQLTTISELEINKCVLLNKAYYLLECIKQFHVKKIIVFLKSINESAEFKKVLDVLNVFFSNKLQVNEINYNTGKTDRNKILSRFKNKNETVNILCNVHILDEGIDIPECDAVYLTHPNYNPINFIQRISRCNRIKPSGSGLENVSHIFIWAKDDKKKESIDKMINEYLKLNTDNTDNVYIRKNAVVGNEKIVVSDESNAVQRDICQKDISITDISIREYLKRVTSVPHEFIDEYSTFYELCETNNFGIPIERLITYLGITNRDKFEQRIRDTYELNIDYVIIRQQQKSMKGVKDAHYMLSFEAFEKICMNSSTKKGQMFRDYFVMLRKFIDYYKQHITDKILELTQTSKFIYRRPWVSIPGSRH